MSHSDQNFKIFITKILSRSNLSNTTLNKFTSDQNMKLFLQAFTDRSFSATSNFELFEFRGDVYINFIAARYVRNRFPKIVSMDWLSRLKIILQSKITLPIIAEKLSFRKFIRISGTIPREKELQILEDVVEAFFGVIVIIAGEHKGAASAISYEILSSLYDDIDIKLDIDLIIELKNRVKEIFDSQKWGEVIYQTYPWKGGFITKIYKNTDQKKELIMESDIFLDKESSIKNARDKVINKFKEFEKVRNPFVQKPKKDAIDLEIPTEITNDFTKWWKKMLLYSGIIEDKISLFMGKKNIQIIRNSFISPKYSNTYNYSLNKFEGNAIVDAILVEFILKNTKISNEGTLSKIRHSITKSDLYSDFAKKFDMIQFAMLKPIIQDEIILDKPVLKNVAFDNQDYNELTRAFIGAFVSVIDSKCGFGIGYEMAYRMLTKYFISINLKVDSSVISDPITDLKELYTKKGWLFDSRGTKTMDYIITEDNIHRITLHDGTVSRKILAIGEGKTKQEAKLEAVKKGLQKLKETEKFKNRF